VEFHGAPLLGVGYGNLPDRVGAVAHNSYVHCYAELGFFGGTFFTAAFFLAATGLQRLAPARTPEMEEQLRDLRLCMVPVLTAYMMGIYSLSRPYGNGTYLILGVTAVLFSFARSAGVEMPQVTGRLARNLVLASVGCVFYFEMFVRLFAH
jgi:O-antigen ligase